MCLFRSGAAKQQQNATAGAPGQPATAGDQMAQSGLGRRVMSSGDPLARISYMMLAASRGATKQSFLGPPPSVTGG